VRYNGKLQIQHYGENFVGKPLFDFLSLQLKKDTIPIHLHVGDSVDASRQIIFTYFSLVQYCCLSGRRSTTFCKKYFRQILLFSLDHYI